MKTPAKFLVVCLYVFKFPLLPDLCKIENFLWNTVFFYNTKPNTALTFVGIGVNKQTVGKLL